MEERLIRHNSGRVKSTKNKGPWKVLFFKKMESRKTAINIERKLKNLKSRKRILNWIIKNTDENAEAGPEFYQIYDLD